MILINCFLLKFMITCKESLSIELDTSSTHSSSVVPSGTITPQLTAKLMSFLVNRNGSFFMLSLPECTHPTFHFMLVLLVQFTLSSPQSSQVPLFWHKENSYYFAL